MRVALAHPPGYNLLPEIQDAHGLPTSSLGVIVAAAFGAGLPESGRKIRARLPPIG